jgi:hypothetical protein
LHGSSNAHTHACWAQVHCIHHACTSASDFHVRAQEPHWSSASGLCARTAARSGLHVYVRLPPVLHAHVRIRQPRPADTLSPIRLRLALLLRATLRRRLLRLRATLWWTAARGSSGFDRTWPRLLEGSGLRRAAYLEVPASLVHVAQDNTYHACTHRRVRHLGVDSLPLGLHGGKSTSAPNACEVYFGPLVYGTDR